MYKNSCVNEQASLEVFFPKGVKSNEKFVFEGQGNKHPCMTAGDVIVTVRVLPHSLFLREGADLILKKEIGFVDALSGVNFTFKHLNGKIVRVKNDIGSVVKDGLKMTMMGYGMPFYHNEVNFGNLFIEFSVNWPEMITSSQAVGIKNLFRTYADTQEEVKEDETCLLQRYNKNQENCYEEGGSNAPAGSRNEGDNNPNENERVQCNNQ